jgi:hypothetical protein
VYAGSGCGKRLVTVTGHAASVGLLAVQLALGIGFCAIFHPPAPWLLAIALLGIAVPVGGFALLVATWRADRSGMTGRSLLIESIVVPVSIACILLLGFVSLITLGFGA